MCIRDRLGMVTVLWSYLRNSSFKKDGVDYHLAADLTSQANHLGVTIEADIIKQKQAENNDGFRKIGFSHTNKKVYEELTSDHPIDLTRYQVAGCYMGRIGLINSGGASGQNDLAQAVRTAVINKRAGGMGLISLSMAADRPTAFWEIVTADRSSTTRSTRPWAFRPPPDRMARTIPSTTFCRPGT